MRIYLIFTTTLLFLILPAISMAKNFQFRCNDALACMNLKNRVTGPEFEESQKNYKDVAEVAYKMFGKRLSHFSYKLENETAFFTIFLASEISEIDVIAENTTLEKDNIRSMAQNIFNGFYDEGKLKSYEDQLRISLFELGIVDSLIDISFSGHGSASGKVVVHIKVHQELVINKIRLDTDEHRFKHLILNLRNYERKRFDNVKFKLLVSSIDEGLVREGFFYNKITYKVIPISKKSVDIIFSIKEGKRINVSFEGCTYFTLDVLQDMAWSSLKAESTELGVENLKNEILSMYHRNGFLDVEIEDSRLSGRDLVGNLTETLIVRVRENQMSRIDEIRFKGNKYLSSKQLRELYERYKSENKLSLYYKSDSVAKFVEVLQDEYSKYGFLHTRINTPDFIRSRKNILIYEISEGPQTILQNISINTSDEKLNRMIENIFYNKPQMPVNFIELSKDVATAQKIAENQGYYFASLENANLLDVLQIKKDGLSADIIIKMKLEKKSIFNNVIITGLEKTKEHVVLREIGLTKGSLLTKEIVKDINENILNLGLFNYVRITPVVSMITEDNYYAVDLLIQVKERDRKSLSFSLGYRTDLGYKVQGQYQYNNIGGENKSASINLKANRRTSLSSLDDRRRHEDKKFIEFSGSTDYSVPYIWGYNLRMDNTFEFSRQRFFGFDAEILRGGIRGSKNLTRKLSASLLYQLETIQQYDATNIKDKGYFRIGGFLPSISYDYRDSYSNPKEGGLISLSFEYAKPEFYSLSKDNIEINFYKAVLRNRFYVTVSDVTLALSASVGVQENLAKDIILDSSGRAKRDEKGNIITKGYIPSVKVFRLDGVDAVRGFADNEINILSNGDDISTIPVTGKAYFANLKIEPRIRLDDNIIWSFFADAGRVYVNKFKPLDMRTGVGTGIKFVTPVGTLDFDYGIKTKRNYLSNGGRESLGRLHMSIGFF